MQRNNYHKGFCLSHSPKPRGTVNGGMKIQILAVMKKVLYKRCECTKASHLLLTYLVWKHGLLLA